MKIADILIAHGLVSRTDVIDALELQRVDGAAIGDCLVRLGKLTAEDLARVMKAAPRSPLTLEDTGLSGGSLLNLIAHSRPSWARIPGDGGHDFHAKVGTVSTEGGRPR